LRNNVKKDLFNFTPRSVSLERVRVQIFFCSIYVAVAKRYNIHIDIALTLYILFLVSVQSYTHNFYSPETGSKATIN